MSQNEYIIAEYNQLKNEIAERVRLLHQFILVAVLLNFVSLLFVFVMIYSNFEAEKIVLFLLLLPIVFALHTFNYQANQMTLEGVVDYISNELKNKMPKEFKSEILKWDKYYVQFRKPFRLTSFLKTFALLLPMTLPIVIYFFAKTYAATFPNNILVVFDLVLFIIVIINFRYKFRSYIF